MRPGTTSARRGATARPSASARRGRGTGRGLERVACGSRRRRGRLRALSVEALGVAAGVAAGATAVLETADDALAERFFAERDERDERNDRAFSGRPERTHGTVVVRGKRRFDAP